MGPELILYIPLTMSLIPLAVLVSMFVYDHVFEHYYYIDQQPPVYAAPEYHPIESEEDF